MPACADRLDTSCRRAHLALRSGLTSPTHRGRAWTCRSPISPTSPSTSPWRNVEVDAVDRLHDLLVQRRSRALGEPAGEVERVDEALATRRRCCQRSAHCGSAPPARQRMVRSAQPARRACRGAPRQRQSAARVQRGAKAQPGGRRAERRRHAGNLASRRAAPAPARHRVDQAARVGMARRVEHGVDRRLPRRCGRHTSPPPGRRGPATTPRSWVIQHAAPCRLARAARCIRSRICAWIGDVERGGRLVGDQQRRACRPARWRSSTRWRMPPENWCG